MRKRKAADPNFHQKVKEHASSYYKKKRLEIINDPIKYAEEKKKKANLQRNFRKKIKEDPIRYKEYLIKQRQSHQKAMSKKTPEEIRLIWKKAGDKYKKTEKGKLSRKLWKQSEKSKEYDKEYGKEYRKNNRGKINAYNRVYRKKKYHSDVHHRLKILLSSIIRRAVRRQRTGKSKRTAQIVGCDFNFLIKYLESKFKPGMSWDNMGTWHIDHIKPVSKFDLKNPAEQEKCFHYSNLQPLWAKENLEKSAKISEKYKNF
tara:strand:- start:447 stop:1223 length:777 start_codon:yes stop_codon:yes gene_type:complete